MGGCFGEAVIRKDALPRTGMRCFSGSCLVKGLVMFCWSGQSREHVMFGKRISIAQQTVDVTLTLVPFADLH